MIGTSAHPTTTNVESSLPRPFVRTASKACTVHVLGQCIYFSCSMCLLIFLFLDAETSLSATMIGTLVPPTTTNVESSLPRPF